MGKGNKEGDEVKRRPYAVLSPYGTPFDGRRADLTLQELAEHKYRAMISPPGGTFLSAPGGVACVIKLDDDATFEALAEGIIYGIAELAATSGATLLVSRRRETLRAVEGALRAHLPNVQVAA